MYVCLAMIDSFFKVKIYKFLSSNVHEGSLILEHVAYGCKVAVKVTFPKAYDQNPTHK